MDKNLKKLYDYCKSQGYQGSTEEFEQEPKNLIVEEIDSKELSKVVGGNKFTRAAAASLVSALSIASPFASAQPNSFSGESTSETISQSTADVHKEKIMQLSSREALKSYKNKIVDGAKKGINYAMQNKKTLKSILLKGVLPSTVILGGIGGVGTALGIGIRNKNLDNKTCKFFAQALAKTFVDCANYCEYLAASPNSTEREVIYNKLKTADYLKDGIFDLDNADYACYSIVMTYPYFIKTCSGKMKFDVIKNAIRNGSIKQHNRKFDISDEVVTNYMNYNIRRDNQQKIINPGDILPSLNEHFRSKIKSDPDVQVGINRLRNAISLLIRESDYQSTQILEPISSSSPSIANP